MKLISHDETEVTSLSLALLLFMATFALCLVTWYACVCKNSGKVVPETIITLNNTQMALQAGDRQNISLF